MTAKEHLTVGEVMTPSPKLINGLSTVQEAIGLMRAHGISSVVVDRRDEGQYWVADGFTAGEIGLFRLDLGTGRFHDFRAATDIDLEGGEHFFSFDRDRFHPSGRAVVVYQGTFQSALVALMEDGSGVTYPLVEGERVVDVTMSPSGERVIVLSGVREIGRRTSVAAILPSDLSSGPIGPGRLDGQKLAVWLPGRS